MKNNKEKDQLESSTSSNLDLSSNDEAKIKANKSRAFISKEWWRQSGSKTMGALGKLSKSFLLPIALLPIAGLFIGIGAALQQIQNPSDSLTTFANLINQMGSVAFSNLPVLFLVSAIIAYTDDSGSAVLAGIVAFLIFNVIIASLSSVGTSHMEYTVTYTITDSREQYTSVYADLTSKGDSIPSGDLQDYVMQGLFGPDWKSSYEAVELTNATQIADSYNVLFYKNVPAALYTDVMGINTLNTGIFAGVIVGCIVAWVYNRTYKVNLPTVINFFSGIKFVPIVMFFAIIPLSLVFIIIWPPIGKGLDWFGENSGKLPYGLDSFIFEIIERSLVPFGLHHVYYSPLWWTAAGGGPLDSDTYAEGWQKWAAATGHDPSDKYLISPNVLHAVGDQTLMYAVLAQSGSTYLTFVDIQKYFGLNLGRFQTGKFPFMMFGLTAAAIAMWLTVPKEHRKASAGIYFSGAITCFLTGVTEPLEYTFLFVAPWLFYGIHMPLAAISFWIMGGLHVHVAQTVSGGFIDMTIFGILPANRFDTRWYFILATGPIFTLLYFLAFYFLIKWRDVKIPGRDEAVATLYTKADFQAKKADKKGKKGNKQLISDGAIILEALGGKENIESVDACASRLRINLHNLKIVDEAKIKSVGATAVVYSGSQCQMIFGGKADPLKSTIKDIMSGKVQVEVAKPKEEHQKKHKE